MTRKNVITFYKFTGISQLFLFVVKRNLKICKIGNIKIATFKKKLKKIYQLIFPYQ